MFRCITKFESSLGSQLRADDDSVPRPPAPYEGCLVFFLIAMVKAFVPRYRYDQLMRLGWKVFLPISLGMVVLVAGVLQFTGWGAGMAQ